MRAKTLRRRRAQTAPRTRTATGGDILALVRNAHRIRARRGAGALLDRGARSLLSPRSVRARAPHSGATSRRDGYGESRARGRGSSSSAFAPAEVIV